MTALVISAAVQNINNGSYSTLYTVPAATTSVVKSLIVSNKSGSNITITVNIVRGVGGSEIIIPGIALGVGSGFECVNNFIALKANDVLQVQTNATNAADAYASIAEGV